jgi:hypothetical protein
MDKTTQNCGVVRYLVSATGSADGSDIAQKMVADHLHERRLAGLADEMSAIRIWEKSIRLVFKRRYYRLVCQNRLEYVVNPSLIGMDFGPRWKICFSFARWTQPSGNLDLEKLSYVRAPLPTFVLSAWKNLIS